jgi:hypothetical protein
MFRCDCPSCGRRELRGPRSLFTVSTPAGRAFAARCRGCGADVHVSGPSLPLAEPREPATAA